MTQRHYSYTTYADPDTARTFDEKRFGGPIGGLIANTQAQVLASLVGTIRDRIVLDVGAGTGRVALQMARGGAVVTAVDASTEMLAVARRRAAAEGVAIRFVVGDAHALEFPDRSFDVAHASLVLHHLGPDAAVQLLHEMARVARLGVVVNDLERARLGWIGAWLMGHLLTRSRFTRHDAPLSVARSYRASEMTGLMRAADLVPVRIVRGAFRQRYAIAAVPASTADDLNLPPDPRGVGE